MRFHEFVKSPAEEEKSGSSMKKLAAASVQILVPRALKLHQAIQDGVDLPSASDFVV